MWARDLMKLAHPAFCSCGTAEPVVDMSLVLRAARMDGATTGGANNTHAHSHRLVASLQPASKRPTCFGFHIE
jgi:hypothetical protein